MSLNSPDTALLAAEPAVTARVLLVPADRFFVQTVPLGSGADAGTQATLALEELAPFPLAQLYHGHLVAPDGSQALVFAAYRRRFSAAETAAWAAADLVLPSFVALLGTRGDGPGLVLHAGGAALMGAAWDGKSPLPSQVLAQAGAEPPAEAQRAAFAAELQAAGGLPPVPVRWLDGAVAVERDPDGGVTFSVDGTETARLAPAALAAADVRDKDFLEEQRRTGRRDLWLWRGLLATAVAAGLAVALDLGALALGAEAGRVRRAVAAAAPQVQRVETAQTLAARIEDLSRRQFRPLEMLALVSERRPRSIQFLRATTKGLYTLEVEAQTPNAADVGGYEVALRGLQTQERVEVRDLRMRDGVTSFVLAVTFKPAALQPEGGPP
jgi:hypothetical protein